MFSVLVWLLLADSEVAEKFKAYTVDGETCYETVRTVLRKRVGTEKLREIEEKDAALYAAHNGELVLLCANDHDGRVVGSRKDLAWTRHPYRLCPREEAQRSLATRRQRALPRCVFRL